MRFADPHACPSCGGKIAGHERCPHCDFVLNSYTSLQLWRTLQEADALLKRAEAESASTPARKPPFASVQAPAQPQAPVPPQAPAQATRPATPADPFAARTQAESTLGTPPPIPVPPMRQQPVARRWPTGSIILGLGALCLVVAALVFITVSWSVLGATGRTVVLLFITTAVAVGAAMATRARLRASAESLWTVFFALFSIDFFAAQALGLFGLDSVDLDPTMLAYGLVMAIGGAGLALATRAALPLAVPSLASGLGVWFSSIWLSAMVDFNFFWSVFAGLALVILAGAAAWKASLRLVALFCGIAAAVFYVVSVGAAIEELGSFPGLRELAVEGHGIPMIVMVVVTVALGLAHSPFVIPAATLATWGLTSLVVAPSVDASERVGYLAISIIAALLALALLRGTKDWIRGSRIASLGLTAVLAISSLGWLANALSAVAESDNKTFTQSWTARFANDPVLPGPGWLAFVVFGALAAAVFASLQWPEGRAVVRQLAPMPVAIAGTGLALGVIAFEPPVLVAALVVLAIAICLLVLTRNEHQVWLGISIFIAVIPAGMTLVSERMTLVVWLAVAATLIAVAVLARPAWARITGAAGATAFVIGSSILAADLTTLNEFGVRLVALAVSLVALVLASFAVRGFVGRMGIEVVGGLGLVSTIVSATDLDIGAQVLIITVVGCAAVALGLLVADRRIYRMVGSGVLVIGVLVRLAANSTDKVEDYTGTVATLVAALVILAIGAWHLARSRDEDDIWLANGILLAVVPAGMTWASQPLTVGVWLAVAVLLAAVASLARPVQARTAGAVGASGLLIGASALLADLARANDLWVCGTAIIVSLLILLAISFPLRAFAGRVGVEITAGVGVMAGLAGVIPLELGSQALVWTIVGAVFGVLGLLVPDRHLFRYLGIAALGVAWVMRLVASNVETPEAYTVPFAVVLLGAGLLAMRDNAQLRTAVALTPGLVLAFVPSLLPALDEPTGLRALLLGLASLLALGVGVWRKWQLPFVFGAIVLALLVLWNVGPLANGLPRWTLIAVAGVLLIGSGITWESRVKNARSAAAFVQNLR